jgi:hypothetical protein
MLVTTSKYTAAHVYDGQACWVMTGSSSQVLVCAQLCVCVRANPDLCVQRSMFVGAYIRVVCMPLRVP